MVFLTAFRPLREIHRIVLTPLPITDRIVFTTGSIPGFPSANQNVENLFDLQIPYRRFGSCQAVENFVLEQTHLTSPGTIAWRWPESTVNEKLIHEIEGETIGELWSRVQPDAMHPIRLDEKTWELHSEPTRWQLLKSKVKSWWPKK